ncbi:MAG: hypothetical protein GY868_08770 [Deltaproteobacteria bacterium]|nr:hypothetical protein [Deltaproteobacteria bacterium]
MSSDYKNIDYQVIKDLRDYPQRLRDSLAFMDDTSQVTVPEDPIENVIFQDRAKKAIRKIAQNRGHILMVGRPGTGKSLLANMFQEVLDRSLGDYLRPRDAIIGYPGKDKNNVRIAYANPESIDKRIEQTRQEIQDAANSMEKFNLSEQIKSVRKVKHILLAATGVSIIAGIFFPPAFIATGLTGIGAIFMFMQENNHKVQEKIQGETLNGAKHDLKHLQDMIPEILYDPRKDRDLMAKISEPDARNMKGGFRHDPYQSGNLQTPIQKRAFLGAHAKAPIIYVDELKTLVKAGYMSSMLEIMQNKEYSLEGGSNTGSGAADRSENQIKADNIIVACCNHDTLDYLQSEGDGAFLSRIEDRGEIVELESAVQESPETILQVAQYIKQETINLSRDFHETWDPVLEKEGHAGVRTRSEHIFGRPLPADYRLETRAFSRSAVAEIIKEMRCRASDGKLSCLLRPINGIIKTAEMEAILDNAPLVNDRHVRHALLEHISLEGSLTKDMIVYKKDLKKYIDTMTDSIGYVVGLAVFSSQSSGQMYGQPLPIHCQVNPGSDTVIAPGKIGEIAQAAAKNVRASIKKVLKRVGAPYVGYEMHIEYIQAHGGVEGDSASVAMDIGLISDYIKQPVNQKFGVTGSLTGDIMLAVGGVTEKVRSIMDTDLGMQGACIPWQNKFDIEPLLVNTDSEYLQENDIPGIRIYREEDKQTPFDIYFCRTKYNAYKILMGLDRDEVERRMGERSIHDAQAARAHHSNTDAADSPPSADDTPLPA